MYSEIKTVNGSPVLFADGKPIGANAYITYIGENSRFDSFAQKGFRLFSVPVYFAGLTINDRSGIFPFSKGIYDSEIPDYTYADKYTEAITRKYPDAMIFPRVNLSLPARWADENPDELCDSGFNSMRRPCFSSDKWLEDTKKYLADYIAHVSQSSYAGNIVGYQIAGGMTEEWFPFDLNGSAGKRSREKFNASGRENTEYELYRFYSETVASAICDIAGFVKKITYGKLVVGAFYGYTFEVTDRGWCHHDLKRVLECDDIDFICSPVSYASGRDVGIDHARMLPVDSLKLHGKLYFAENDTRTHLTRPPCELEAYNTAIWQPRDREETVDILKMHFAAAFCRNTALWWFDMWGGWFDCDEYMSLLEKMLDMTLNECTKPPETVSEAAVFVDETAYAGIGNGSSFFCYSVRQTLGLAGAPYDSYLMSDFDSVYEKYKFIIILHAADTPLTLSAEKKAEDKHHLIITNDTAEGITPSVLREMMRNSGVHIYTDSDNVVYANEKYVFIHTHSDGVLNVNMPYECRLESVFSSTENGDFVKGGKSILFRIKNLSRT